MNITINMPDELAYSVNEPQQSLVQKAKQAFVMTLLAEHKLSISQAAHWLELSVYDTMKLAGQQHIDLISVDELEDEFAQAVAQRTA
jgi:hypothetical protein